MFLNAWILCAKSESLLLSAVQDQKVSQMLEHVFVDQGQLIHVEVFDALVVVEVLACELSVADLAHDLHFWAFHLYVIVELRPCHVLVLILVADIASEFRTVELSVCVQLSEGHPDDLASVSGLSDASVWELTEIDAVSQYFVDFL